MKAKEKAKELVLKSAFKGAQHEGEAKKFALIAVDEIIELAYWEYMESMGEKEEKYWEEVKQEIQLL
jgi:hypothetical protein